MNLHSYLLQIDNLWDSLANASKKPVGDVMNTWTKQMGFPVLNVSMEVVRGFLRLSVLSF